MNWILPKTKINEEMIKKVEEKFNILFPEDFKEVILKYNGASPIKMAYDTEKTKERVAEYLLSFSPNDLDNIYEAYDSIKERGFKELIPIMRDPFGNFICYDFTNKSNPKIMFWNHENNDVEYIANSFKEFLGKLYE